MPRPNLPSWPTTLTTLAVLIIHALVLWILSDLIFNRSPDESIPPGPYLISALILSTLLLPILILAIRGRRPRGQRHCPLCWYTLDPALGLKCPECGHEATSDRHTRKPRRRWKLAAATLCLITLCQLTWLETRIRSGGWLAAVPTEALIIGMPWVPEYTLTGDRHQATPQWLLGTNKLADWSLSGRSRYLTDDQFRWANNRAIERVLTTTSSSQCSDRYVLVARLSFVQGFHRDVSTTVPWQASLHMVTLMLSHGSGATYPTVDHLAYTLEAAVIADPSSAEQVSQALAHLETEIVAVLIRDPGDARLRAAAYVLISLMVLRPESLDLLEQHLDQPMVAQAFVLAARQSELAIDRITAHLQDSNEPARQHLLAILNASLIGFPNNAVQSIVELELSEPMLRDILLLLVGPPHRRQAGLYAAFEVVSRAPKLAPAFDSVMLAELPLLIEFAPDALEVCKSEHHSLRQLGTAILRRIVYSPGFPESERASEVLTRMRSAIDSGSMEEDTHRRISLLTSRLQERIANTHTPR